MRQTALRHVYAFTVDSKPPVGLRSGRRQELRSRHFCRSKSGDDDVDVDATLCWWLASCFLQRAAFLLPLYTGRYRRRLFPIHLAPLFLSSFLPPPCVTGDEMRVPFFFSSSAILLLSAQSWAKPVYEDRFFKRGTSSLTSDGASLDGMQFDFVIVGGGTAGLAAAYELAKDPRKRTLVIEAGSDTRSNDKVSKQSSYTQAFGDKELDWNSATVPQQTAGGAVRHLHAGKGLGGTSTINGGAFSVPPSSQSEHLELFLCSKAFVADFLLPRSRRTPEAGKQWTVLVHLSKISQGFSEFPCAFFRSAQHRRHLRPVCPRHQWTSGPWLFDDDEEGPAGTGLCRKYQADVGCIASK